MFGKYVQEADGEPEPIEWQVLEREKDRILVISKYALDCKQYNDGFDPVTWETCSLRSWLNGEFLDAAFSEDEKAMIPAVTVSADKNPKYKTDPGNSTTDRVFLLSIEEVNRYFGSDDDARKCRGTAYCHAQGAAKSSDGFCWWCLRSPGYISDNAANIYYDGSVDECGNNFLCDDCGVRPALWIDLCRQG
ncbi:MAG: hypothetical protein E7474_05200 [Ruminococcaceae bacterium]|nr:hypothetical protein [Oscillospiraceae bacterium]